MQEESRQTVVGIFHEVPAFERALDELLKAGFDASAISVLGSHKALLDHFGKIPPPTDIADAPDAPRDPLDTEVALHRAIDFIAGTFAIISEVGVAAAAYAVGGPVGVAAGSATVADTTVDSVLSNYVDDSYRSRFEENIRDGGVICWVEASTAHAAAKASQVLTAAGGEHVHAVAV
jgi:hypothetical protein